MTRVLVGQEVAMQAQAFVLAGGVSSRMGHEKHLLELGGVPLVLRIAQLALPLVKRVAVVGLVPGSLPTGFGSIADEDYGFPAEPGRSKGPLFGIATALSNSQSPWNLILACDLPYLTAEWLGFLLARAEKTDAEIVMPYVGQEAQPLAAMYRRECRPTIIELLRRGVRRVKDTLREFAVEAVPESEWHELDPQGIVLKNMNTPADYDEACKWWIARESLSQNKI
jgi:molybdenum cofactor guanylyltransferase